jgi:hypothetical protein
MKRYVMMVVPGCRTPGSAAFGTGIAARTDPANAVKVSRARTMARAVTGAGRPWTSYCTIATRLRRGYPNLSADRSSAWIAGLFVDTS